uniref:pentatricopeptide repeat-containing protein At1g05750, chloroplastic-like n=1 Tax=Erigeron canadensis TaxID=72917 RepID=UPI001CB8DF61|nr:pentatricopeptide repeat-containing protein At1g05750, chloroplastic-like [Erigeron canadensis]
MYMYMLVEHAFPSKTIIKQPSRFLQQHIFNLLQNPNQNPISKTTQIHTQIIINNLTNKNFIIVKLLQSYISIGHFQLAHKTFNQIQNPSTTSWNQIIRGYAGSGSFRDALQLFDEMLQRGTIPDEYSYCYVISACARGKVLRFGETVHGRVLVSGFCGNVFLGTNLVNFYAGFGKGEDLRKVFDGMSVRNVVTLNTLLGGYVKCCDIDGAKRVFKEMPERNVISWTTLVSGCVDSGECKEALCLFREMLRECMELDHVTLVAALSACAEIGDLKMGRWIHSYIDRSWDIKKKECSVRLNNALLHMYAGCGVIDDAYEIFKRMSVKSTVSWTSMILGFAKQGRGRDALSVFQRMEQEQERAEDDSSKPDFVTMLAVLYACSHSGLVEEGRHIFSTMYKIWGIEPQIEHYGCMVDLLSRAGLLDEALKLVEAMPMKPNDAIWGALLGGCRIYKDVNLASQIAKKLANLHIVDDKASAYLVLLSNVYASVKRWKDVENVREKMVQLALKKPAGRSWVQIGELVHEFLAGDRTHKLAPLIYDTLLLLTVEAGFNGYKPDVYEAPQPFVTH